jgi:formylglycine-generating enzyme required for sulfatase activity
MSLELEPGAQPVPNYRLIRKLGQGGFGAVWEAEAPGGVRVALKFIVLDAEPDNPELRALDVIRNIRHPHLLDVQFAVRHDDTLIIAMPLCERTLGDRLKECQRSGLRGVPPGELIEYMTELAGAIDYLNEPRHPSPGGHLMGVQHRDIKPHNIFLVAGHVRLADFGLAKMVRTSGAGDTGAMTPQYVSPEQIDGRVSTRSDQYSLAATYVHVRAGHLPFDGTVGEILGGHLRRSPDLKGLVDAELAVVARALAKEPVERWPNCRAFAHALRSAVLAEHAAPTPTTRVPSSREPAGAALDSADHDNALQTLTNSIGMKLALIPAGEFMMGARDGEPEARDDEKPQHRVRITKPFYLGVFAVTQREYRRVTGTDPSWFSASGGGKNMVAGDKTGQYPVENVSWLDAVAFCNKLSAKERLTPCYAIDGENVEIRPGTGYRLPTEAEWEYACRAGTETPFAFGARLSPTEANFDARYTYNGSAKGPYLERTAAVGSYRPNAFGLYDMHGNVWEWCWDGYDAEAYAAAATADPVVPPSRAALPVFRGGSWNYYPQGARSAYRRGYAPSFRVSYLGFRVARVR